MLYFTSPWLFCKCKLVHSFIYSVVDRHLSCFHAVFWWISPVAWGLSVSRNGLARLSVCVSSALTDNAELFREEIAPGPTTTSWIFWQVFPFVVSNVRAENRNRNQRRKIALRTHLIISGTYFRLFIFFLIWECFSHKTTALQRQSVHHPKSGLLPSPFLPPIPSQCSIRWCIIELNSWNPYNFINQCHPNTFDKKYDQCILVKLWWLGIWEPRFKGVHAEKKVYFLRASRLLGI